MNKRQLIVMWVGIGIIVLIALFPPTLIVSLSEAEKNLVEMYSFSDFKSMGDDIFQRPVFLFAKGAKEIQYDKMVICQFIVALITSGLIITFQFKRKRGEV